jgi:hypothetical protein
MLAGRGGLGESLLIRGALRITTAALWICGLEIFPLIEESCCVCLVTMTWLNLKVRLENVASRFHGGLY